MLTAREIYNLNYVHITIDAWEGENANDYILHHYCSGSYDKVYESVANVDGLTSNDIVEVFYHLEELSIHGDQMPLEDPKVNWLS